MLQGLSASLSTFENRGFSYIGLFWYVYGMGNAIRTSAAYLRKVAESSYQIPAVVSGVVNYALDSYFTKLNLFERQRYESLPDEDPMVLIMEKWIECELHKAVTVDKGYPGYAQAQNAWAFDKMFGENSVYEIVPYVDSFEFKAYVKKNYRVVQKPCSVSLTDETPLVVYGKFFVRNRLTGAQVIVEVDFAYDQMGCSVSAVSSPAYEDEAAAFIRAFDASIRANDIYSGKCLSFTEGILEFTPVIPTTWDDVVLGQDVVDVIRHNSTGVLENMDKLASIGMCPNRNIMLISPPGMAKTTIFRAISNEIDEACTRIWCTGKSIGDSYDVTTLFEAARQLAPCILFIEDMDLFGQNRAKLNRSENGVLNEFLANLDGVQDNAGVIIMASTNDVASMDEALVNRPGRFDVKVEMPYPDKSDRAQMLKKFFQTYNALPDRTVTADNWDNVLDMTDGLTGAYLKDLVKAVVIRSIANGGYGDDCVAFCNDDFVAGADHVVKNFQIAKRAMTRDYGAQVASKGSK